MELNRKTTGIIIIGVAVALGVILVAVYLMMDKPVQEEPIDNVYIEHPDAVVQQASSSKMDAYLQNSRSRSSIEDYWDSIEDQELEQEDLLADMTSDGRTERSSLDQLRERSEGRQRGIVSQEPKPVQPAQNDYAASASSGGSDYAPASSGGSRPRKSKEERIDEYMALRQQVTDEYIDNVNRYSEQLGQQPVQEATLPQVDPEPVQEESIAIEEPVAEQPKVKRSGNISTLDDGFSTLTAGISSLDSESDELDMGSGHPLKCMFVREEKLESGQRVSIRLLEDMVVAGTLVPKNTHLMAVCTIERRLMLKVTSIELNGQIYSMNYEAYDNDGAKGIYCPDIDNTAKESARQGGVSIGRRSFTKMGQIAGEVANIGMTIAESIGGSGSRTVRVPSGYTFYLMAAKEY